MRIEKTADGAYQGRCFHPDVLYSSGMAVWMFRVPLTLKLEGRVLHVFPKYNKSPHWRICRISCADPRVSESEVDWRIKVIVEYHFISSCALLQ